MASSSNKSAVEANLLGKRKSGDDLETRQFLRKHKERSEEKETTEGFADDLQQIKGSVELLETKSDQANFISAKETTEGFGNSLQQIKSGQANLTSVKEVAARKRKLFVANLSPETKISEIINFFENEVVSVRLIVNRKGERARYGFVEFASANEAKKALEKKTGECLCGRKIFLDLAEIASYPPKYCIDHKVWYEDYLGRGSLVIKEDETVEVLDDEHLDFDQEVPARKKTLFVANLSPQTKISDIKRFFKNAEIFSDVGEVVSVRLIVNREGKHVGCGFVEFATAYAAKKALKEKKGEYLCGQEIFLQLPQIAPYPPQHKYSLVEMLWYEDEFLREILPMEDDLETKEKSEVGVFCGKKTIFSEDG